MSHDLIAIIFPLEASADASLPVDNGRIMQGAFLKWVQLSLPELAVKLHDQYQRFYTVSGLHGDFCLSEHRLQIRAGHTAWFRVTALQAEIAEALLELAAETQTGPRLDDGKWLPGHAQIDPETNEFVQLTSFAALAEAAQNLAALDTLSPEVMLHFNSPTCFMENEQSLPLPVPRYVFGYLFNQWQITSPFPLPIEDIDSFINSIHLAYAGIKTRSVDYQKFRRVGFTGQARFGLHPKLPPLYRMLLHLLAGFAGFSGVGSHTAMGMGQTLQEIRR